MSPRARAVLRALAFGTAHTALFVLWTRASDFALAVAELLREATRLPLSALAGALALTTIATTATWLRGLRADEGPARAIARAAAWGAANALLLLAAFALVAGMRDGAAARLLLAFGLPFAGVAGALAGGLLGAVDLLVLRTLPREAP